VQVPARVQRIAQVDECLHVAGVGLMDPGIEHTRENRVNPVEALGIRPRRLLRDNHLVRVVNETPVLPIQLFFEFGRQATCQAHLDGIADCLREVLFADRMKAQRPGLSIPTLDFR